MDIALSVAAFLFSVIGIAGCILPILPGVVLSYVGLLCAAMCSYSQLSSGLLWIFLAVTVVVSAVDYFLPAYMTRLFGGSRAGAIGATIGVVAGLFLGGFAGIILGPFVGAVLGELLHNRQDAARALLVGLGSFFSFLVGTGLKLIASVAMLIYVWRDTYTVLHDWISTTF